jgi:hypothetical protein
MTWLSRTFLHFPAGTGITTVWAWFETMNPAFTVPISCMAGPPGRSSPCLYLLSTTDPREHHARIIFPDMQRLTANNSTDG